MSNIIWLGVCLLLVLIIINIFCSICYKRWYNQYLKINEQYEDLIEQYEDMRNSNQKVADYADGRLMELRAYQAIADSIYGD